MDSQNKFKETLNKLVSKDKSGAAERANFRRQNRYWLQKSADIALKIIDALKEKNITQVQLAAKLSVSPQNVSKILKGQENLTLESIAKLERALNIELIFIPQYQRSIAIELPTINFSPFDYAQIFFPFMEEITVKAPVYSTYEKQSENDDYQIVA